MGTVIDSAAAERRAAFKPGHALVDALDCDMGRNRMVESRRDMRQNAKRTTIRMICGRRGIGSGAFMLARTDHDTGERIGGCGGGNPHHRDRCKELHQNRDHDDGNQMSQPLAHCFPHRMT